VILVRILYILPVNWGGIPHYTAELANAMANYAEVVVLKPKGSNDQLFSNHVKVINVFEPLSLTKGHEKNAISISNLKNFLSYSKVNVADSIKPDIIHFPGTYVHAAFFSSLYRLNKNFPIVQTKHSVADPYLQSTSSKGFFRTLLWNLNDSAKYLPQPDAYIVHTKENRQSLINEGISSDKISIVPHGSYTFFKKYQKSSSDCDNSKNILLYFGYIDRHKGVDQLINAIPIVAKEVPDVKVIIAGEGSLSECCSKIDNESYFEIINEFVPDERVSDLFTRAKIIVLPYTYHQGLSGVLSIAFAFGKPVIVTDVGNLAEFADGCGLVVPPNDSNSLANSIIHLINNNELREKLSKASEMKGKELSWDNIARKHLKIYGEAVSRYLDK